MPRLQISRKVTIEVNIEDFLRKTRVGGYPIGILERWNAGIMGLDFNSGLQMRSQNRKFEIPTYRWAHLKI